MTDLIHTETSRPSVQSYSEGYLGIFVVSFAMLFVIALGAQMLTLQWRSWLPGAEGQKSLIGGVKASVYTFMSYLT